MDLSTIESFVLIRELISRGYVTDLIFCREDVDKQLKRINDQRFDDDKTVVEINDIDKDTILYEIFNDAFVDEFEKTVMQKISSHIKTYI